MNIHSTEPNEFLQPYVDAVRDQLPDEDRRARAQRKLMTRLADGKPSRSAIGLRTLRWAPAAAALLIVPMLLVWLPGPMGSVAFADVQRYFNQFESMIVRITTTMAGEPVNEVTVQMDAENRTRLDSGDAFTFIIDPDRRQMLQLFHGPGIATRVPLDSDQTGPEAARLEWLDELRAYQGQAQRLDATRTIAGREATGFALQSGGLDMVLWAADDGEPLRLEMQPEAYTGPEGIEIGVDFSFDRPLDPGAFSLKAPAGYQIRTDADAID